MEKRIEIKVHEFWRGRADLGVAAGTRDIPAKQLEIKAISAYVRDGMRILDIGCGNGLTAIELARQFQVSLLGIDFAEEMILAATELAEKEELRGSLRFQKGDVQNLAELSGKFDLIYTERVLINLPDWETQREAIMRIAGLLVEGGLYVMCENSQDGLEKINDLRRRAGLAQIKPPWHNRYLRDSEIQGTVFPGLQLKEINFYSSTYYFLSRVVNAWLASQRGEEPLYEAPVNQLALQLPPLGDWGQGRIWLWRKVSSTPLEKERMP